MWTLEEGLEFCRWLRPYVQTAGYDVGLTGSILYWGESDKDLDVILYPYNSEKQDRNKLYMMLTQTLMSCTATAAYVQTQWKTGDKKHVEKWEKDGKRIDLFFMQ